MICTSAPFSFVLLDYYVQLDFVLVITLSVRHPGEYEVAYSFRYLPYVRPVSTKDSANGVPSHVAATVDKKRL